MNSIATNLAALQTSHQGIYAIVVHSPVDSEIKLYIGSSYGQFGLEFRISQHRSPTYRAAEPSKALYRHWGSQNYYFKLVDFGQLVEPELVLFVESCFQRLFGSRSCDDRTDLALSRLSNCSYGALNRSEPICEGSNPQFGDIKALFSRVSKLKAVQQNEPMPVYEGRRQSCLCIAVFKIHLSIPADICQEWNLRDNFETKTPLATTWSLSCADTQRWATRSQPSDDGYNLGVMISKIINGTLHTHWLHDVGSLAPKMANTLFDFISGRIVGVQGYV